MPNEAAGNNRATPDGQIQRQDNRVAEQGLRFEPRQTRSRGPAPNIPNVLPNAPERSAAVREELIQIHDAHENRTCDAEN